MSDDSRLMMSLILGYTTPEYSIIMSDGRAGQNGCLSEHYNKTLKVNDNIILGFAGFAEPIDYFLKHVISQMGNDRDKYSISDFWELLCFLFDDIETKEHFDSTLLIIGRDERMNMHTSIIGDCTNYILEKNKVSTPRISSIGGTIDSKTISDTYMRNIRRTDLTVIDRMKQTINDVAQLDPSVNKNHFIVTI